MRAILVIGICLTWATAVWGGQAGYVSDSVEITVRTSPGMDRKIFDMIRTGQELEILATQEDWTHIRLPSGREGWVLSRFVTTDAPAAVRLAELEKTHQRMLNQAEAPIQEIARLEGENQRLSELLAEARQAAERLEAAEAARPADRDASPGVKAAYKRATAQLAQQRQRITDLEKEQAWISSKGFLQWFLAGAGVLLAGFLLGSISRSKRRRSSLL
ncbi:MAG: TIGR04211 family SH3 domain-containing protein [Desulfobacterales bacterium]|nr:TIGR04211 family SH3 domain-containing protein [Desulfobacterales bacterium]